ncbi:hypothetical protein BCO18430_00266 [Burkholderia contaminans]|uniref:hypothetical protein n=1 Tax=Burkholderia contaminans TaxID=488447 RepID=UPI001452F45B|nr:hypothetical protein [Burkholderia contaminans]VWC55930.1 hypothetical protein BCO18430_00266 [Burkholderia contaminans]
MPFDDVSEDEREWIASALRAFQVIGELDAPALSPYARVVTYRDAGRLLLATESAVSSSDIAQLERAAVLDPQVPALRSPLPVHSLSLL